MERTLSPDEIRKLADRLHTDESMILNILVQAGSVGVASKADLKEEGILNGEEKLVQE